MSQGVETGGRIRKWIKLMLTLLIRISKRPFSCRLNLTTSSRLGTDEKYDVHLRRLTFERLIDFQITLQRRRTQIKY